MIKPKRPTKRAIRKNISISLRFKVFQRDSFTCNYCGKGVKDKVVLEVDHIIPVVKGGTNEIENLITACYDCNRGKRDEILTGSKVKHVVEINEELNRKIGRQEELEKQLKKYYKYQKKLQSYDPLKETINRLLSDELGFTLTVQGYKGFNRIYSKLNFDDFIQAIKITKEKKLPNIENKKLSDEEVETIFKYLCGIMWNLYRSKTDPYFKANFEVRNAYLYHQNKKGSNYYQLWKMTDIVKYMVNMFPDDYINKFKTIFGEVFEGKHKELGSTYFDQAFEASALFIEAKSREGVNYE